MSAAASQADLIVPTCSCDDYVDLPIDEAAIDERISQFTTMRQSLTQISRNVVVKWGEQYRLYKCGVCGQYWQASYAPRDIDFWYLYKVPETGISSWKRRAYVPPGEILDYLRQREEFLSQRFEIGKKNCADESCGEKAIAGVRKCPYHQFLEVDGGETREWLLNLMWFPPYDPSLVDRPAN